eukprot:scaffold79333_cov27-Phaeocystis_antarctica.AAC.1
MRVRVGGGGQGGEAKAKVEEHLAEAAHCGDHLDVRSQPAARQRAAHGGQQPRRDHVGARLAVRTQGV